MSALAFRLKTVGSVCRSVIFNEDRSCIFDKWIPGDCRALPSSFLSFDTWRRRHRCCRGSFHLAVVATMTTTTTEAWRGAESHSATLAIRNWVYRQVLVVVVFGNGPDLKESNSLVASLCILEYVRRRFYSSFVSRTWWSRLSSRPSTRPI